ncbi:FAD-binding oxidoreductase [Oceanibium sediminis]|uniref:FAD-binding oxidoreductase n=1 Tax=Oceanibium sediminis TaxID=2026339 RepID=UPI000DD397E3|nr:FAD-binding oxidoreductase [Oceanibium sediminis]
MQLNRDRYTGWGRVLSAAGGRARPEKARMLDGAPLGPAMGQRRAYGDAALKSAGPALDMTRLDRMLAFDPDTGVLEAEAGVKLSDILTAFAPKGWRPAVLPGTGFATLGGAIAADVHGKNHHEAGTFGAQVLSIRLIGSDGTARDVSETTEPEVFRATLGGMGLTGVILSAKIRLAPCPSGFVDVDEWRIGSLAAYLEAFEASDAPFSVGWIDATAKGPALGRGVFEEARVSNRAPAFAPVAKSRNIPITPPGFVLSGPVVRAFNAAYFRRIPSAGQRRTRPLASFFHPLDGLTNWNRLYGKKGFHQFQCVLPPDSAAMTIDTMLRRIADSGLAAPLAVLKKMGAGRSGPMSFPMAGYTLAVDFPNRGGAEALINTLIDQTVEAGGRIYLAKDSLATPAQIDAMYPELPDFRALVRRLDPEGLFETDLSARLNLRGAS